jgi:hypothetical protein
MFVFSFPRFETRTEKFRDQLRQSKLRMGLGGKDSYQSLSIPILSPLAPASHILVAFGQTRSQFCSHGWYQMVYFGKLGHALSQFRPPWTQRVTFWWIWTNIIRMLFPLHQLVTFWKTKSKKIIQILSPLVTIWSQFDQFDKIWCHCQPLNPAGQI